MINSMVGLPVHDNRHETSITAWNILTQYIITHMHFKFRNRNWVCLTLFRLLFAIKFIYGLICTKYYVISIYLCLVEMKKNKTAEQFGLNYSIDHQVILDKIVNVFYIRFGSSCFCSIQRIPNPVTIRIKLL